MGLHYLHSEFHALHILFSVEHSIDSFLMHLIEWKYELCYPWKFSPLNYDLYYTVWGTWCSFMWWLYDIWCALDMLCDLSRCYMVCAINVAWSFIATRSYRLYRLCDLVCVIWFTTCYSCMPSSHDTPLWWFCCS